MVNFKQVYNTTISMFVKKDYSKLTLEQLLSEEKRMNAQKIPFALFVGLLVGMAIWSATHSKGFVMTVVLLISAVLSSTFYSRNLKSVQMEISHRETDH